MWTINDFLAYGNLSGCTVKGKFACPPCGSNIHSMRLKHSKKHVYMGHRRYLPKDHKYRRNKAGFDGNEEWGDPPMILNGNQVWNEVSQIVNDFGKSLQGKRKRKIHDLWKKKSIFFDLPYWQVLTKLCSFTFVDYFYNSIIHYMFLLLVNRS